AFLKEGRGNVTDRPLPLQFYYVGAVPLYEALPNAKYLGEETWLGRKCETFLFSNVKGSVGSQCMVYTLDKLTGVPLKAASYAEESDIDKQLPGLTWATNEVKLVEKHLVPSRSESAVYASGDSLRTRQRVLSNDYKITIIKYDQVYDSSLFWPDIERSGAVINDTIKKEIKVPRGEVQRAVNSSTEARSLQQIRADAPVDWTSTFSGVSFIFGVLTVLVGGVVWWRRR
ncbi:MAG: hypothetical protein ACHRXM_34295, partial [Isosphaerales bacterium]